MWNVWYLLIAAIAVIIVGVVWGFIDGWWNSFFPPTISTLAGILAFILLGIVVFRPIQSRQNISEFEYTKQMVVESVENGSDLQNAAVTSIIIEMNQWLMSAKAQNDTIGNWSIYNAGEIGKLFDALTPITLNSEKGGG